MTSAPLGADAASDGHWLAVETVAADASGPFVQRILGGALGAVVVPRALSPDTCLAWAERLDAGEHPVTPTRFAREFEAWSFGPCLDQSEGDLDGYLARVPGFEEALARSAAFDVGAALVSQLERLGIGLEVERPVTADGRRYGLVTLRGLPPGGLIPPHCENEQLPRRAYDALRPLLDTRALLSFYVMLRPGQSGGALSVHDLGSEAIGARTMHGHSAMTAEVAASRAVRFDLEPGSLVLFDGGRRFHQVLPVAGARDRWTLGGFAAGSADGTRLLVWA